MNEEICWMGWVGPAFPGMTRATFSENIHTETWMKGGQPLDTWGRRCCREKEEQGESMGPGQPWSQ